MMQTAPAGFIEDGLLDQHIRRSGRVYAERHHLACRGSVRAAGRPPDSPHRQRGTTHRRPFCVAGSREDAILHAADHGIGMLGLQQSFHASPPQQDLLLGFSAITTDLPAALRTLGRIVASNPDTNGPHSSLRGR